MNTTGVLRRWSIALMVAVTLAVTGCDIGMSIGSGSGDNYCLMGGCGGGGGYDWGFVPIDSIVIAQRDTTIILGDSLNVRFRLYPDSATAIYLFEATPVATTQTTAVSWESDNTLVWRVRPTAEGTLTVIVSDYGLVSDTLLVQVTRPAP